jgi:RNA polymerase sigma-70 factor (ECF subfamily)
MSVGIKYFNNEEDAALCINDSFIKICDKIESYNPDYSFITWSRTILTRTIIDELRKRKKYHETILISDKLEFFESHEDQPEEEPLVDNNTILQAMENLPKATKHVVKMYLIEGHSHQDISGILNISTETSKWHLKTGKKKIRELLSDYKQG